MTPLWIFAAILLIGCLYFVLFLLAMIVDELKNIASAIRSLRRAIKNRDN